jgi:hypothetical protein
MSEHGSVEQELWNIFTFYTLHGNPMYPDLLKSSQFTKLCKQCLIMRTPEMPDGLPGAVINVVYIGRLFVCCFYIILVFITNLKIDGKQPPLPDMYFWTACCYHTRSLLIFLYITSTKRSLFFK